MASSLVEVGERIWICDGPLVDFYGFPYPTRMVVVRLTSGGLWIWSPIALTPSLQAEVGQLGPVKHLISPNKLHHLYLKQWAEANPTAMIWGMASLIRRRKDISFSGPLEDDAPVDWQDDFDQVVFRGSLFMDEIVFFHHPSRTALFGDLIENFSMDYLVSTPGWTAWKRLIARLWRITEPFGMAPLEWRLSFVNRRVARQSLERIIQWDVERVIMAHGTCVSSDGKEFIERSFRWLRKPPPEVGDR